jgi:N-acetylglucosamine-6-phosphate deacetylase
MTELTAYTGARIFDGETWHEAAALVVDDDMIHSIGPVPAGARTVAIDRGLLVPGFIDLQVNGGGGHLVGPGTTVADLQLVCDTHAGYGVTALLPTLITDTAEVTDAVLAAGATAARQGLPGFLGLHLEGPHLARSRKGAHDPALIRPMDESDLLRFLDARRKLPNLLVTVAAEVVRPEQVARLAEAGIVVSIGHSDATYAQVQAAVEAGATMATHLFNAQSQIGNREPGVVGAVLDSGALNAGLIADGIHVHPASIGIALRAKRGPGQIFLVTDAMSPTGTDWTEFELTGQTVYRKNGALRLSDGTLAGADLTMIDAIRYVHRTIGVPLEEALRMASLYPAQALGVAATHGHLNRGARADFVVLSDDLEVKATWIGGEKVFG